MWPALVPGDILRAEYREIGNILPGQVIVLEGDENTGVVHRVIRVTKAGTLLLIVTGGDRSGIDLHSRIFSPESRVPLVTGVLRNGLYQPIRGRIPLSRHVPSFLIRAHLAIARYRNRL